MTRKVLDFVCRRGPRPERGPPGRVRACRLTAFRDDRLPTHRPPRNSGHSRKPGKAPAYEPVVSSLRARSEPRGAAR